MYSQLLAKLFIFITSFAALSVSANAEAMTVELEPDLVEINTFYKGGDVDISGEIPAESDVLIRLSGENHEISMKKKGKVSGVLWMNVSDVTFKNIPPAYLIYTSRDSKESVENLGLGFSAIKDQIQILPQGEDEDLDFNNFLKLKKKEHLYGMVTDAVRFDETDDFMKPFEARIHLPPRLKQGTYKVDVITFNDNGIVDEVSRELKLEQSGFPAFLSAMAYNRSLLHGFLAVVSALLAGLGMSIIFKDKGGAH